MKFGKGWRSFVPNCLASSETNVSSINSLSTGLVYCGLTSGKRPPSRLGNEQ